MKTFDIALDRSKAMEALQQLMENCTHGHCLIVNKLLRNRDKLNKRRVYYKLVSYFSAIYEREIVKLTMTMINFLLNAKDIPESHKRQLWEMVESTSSNFQALRVCIS